MDEITPGEREWFFRNFPFAVDEIRLLRGRGRSLTVERDRLREYVRAREPQHGAACLIWLGIRKSCDCGYTECLAAWRAALGEKQEVKP